MLNEQVTKKFVKKRNDKMLINVKNSSYEVIVKSGILSNIFCYIKNYNKIAIVIDDNIPRIYLDNLLQQKKDCYSFIVEHGEKNKTIDTYLKIQKFLLENNFSRSDLIIALGGGVIGDIVGFVASTYKRGIDYIQIPTTTLSQIDSSIGGKTAINYLGFKNSIGTFYHPQKVFIDIDVLKTLSQRDFYNGLVEALKIALLFDKKLFETIESNDFGCNIEYIIKRSIEFKKDIVEKDEYEKGLRKVLNFGHTIGHGIESLYGGEKLHGECIAKGMLYFIRNENLKKRVIAIFNRFNIKLEEEPDIKKIVYYIKNDKKINDEKINVVVLNDIGKFEICNYNINEIENIIRDGF